MQPGPGAKQLEREQRPDTEPGEDDLTAPPGSFLYTQYPEYPVLKGTVNARTTLGLRSVRAAWAGLRTFAPDRSPVAGEAPGHPGFVWLAGQGGYGIQTSPALSRLAADLILGLPPALPDATVAALSPSRFR